MIALALFEGVTIAIRHDRSTGTASREIDLAHATKDGLIRSTNWIALPISAASVVPTAPTGPHYLSMPWKLSDLDTRATALTINYIIGDNSCYRPVAIVLQETPDSVAIEAVSRQDPDQTVCPSRYVVRRATLTLKIPLGRRTLFHAAVDDQWKSFEKIL